MDEQRVANCRVFQCEVDGEWGECAAGDAMGCDPIRDDRFAVAVSETVVEKWRASLAAQRRNIGRFDPDQGIEDGVGKQRVRVLQGVEYGTRREVVGQISKAVKEAEIVE